MNWFYVFYVEDVSNSFVTACVMDGWIRHWTCTPKVVRSNLGFDMRELGKSTYKPLTYPTQV